MTEPNAVDGRDRESTPEEIAAALAGGQIIPWFQPVIQLSTGRMVGVEALARWRQSAGVIVAPDRFLPQAERSGLVLELDREIADRAFSELLRWQRVRPDFRVSINLSGRHFDHSGAADLLAEMTARAGVAAGSVDVEVTESTRPQDMAQAAIEFSRLAEHGFTIWLDDFGSGWSTLRDLIGLPVGGLKLDASFAALLGTETNDLVIETLAEMLRRSGRKLTIEGIESLAQLTRAVDLGCQLGQGYYWSRPVPAEKIADLLAAERID